MKTGKKILLAVAAGVASVGLFGAAALGAFGPGTSANVVSAVAPAASAILGTDKDGQDGLKKILDGLVQKGVITQQQEDAILAAAKDAKTSAVRTAKVVRDFLGESATYLGMSEKDMLAKLPGTSLGKLADATAGKSKAGLVAALSTAANADITKALTEKKITDDQAKKLRDNLPTEISNFVDRTWPAKAATAPRVSVPNIKSFLGDLTQISRDYLGGMSLKDLTAALRSGKSLGEIATANGKTPDGLIAALTLAVNTRIDQAVTDKKLTPEQAATLKAKVSAEVTTFVNRKATLKPATTAGRTTAKP